ncbi:MAG: glycosyltransferase family 9 protein [Candidatus Caenarcaniphilales bacterium]|jgi:lipopolysaccharide heptosyltransferase I|nr:glycosyltransferase family 9 protein [Candidatus Caenarcaniphilales bacterium]
MKILIIKLSSLGDIVHAIPAANAIKQAMPDATIDWLVYGKFSKILKSQSSIRNIIKLENKSLKNFLAAAKYIRDQKYDLVIDLQGLIKTGLLAFASGAYTLGFKEPREIIAASLYREKADLGQALDDNEHVIDKNLKLIKSYFLNASLEPDFGALNSNISNITIKTRDYQNVCIIPGTTWESKFWAAENWQEFLEQVYDKYQSQIYIVGSNKDLLIIESIITKIKFPFKLVINKDLLELPEFFRSMSLIVGVDTGPLHIAAAACYNYDHFKTKIIGLYGPSSGQRSGPYGFDYIRASSAKALNKRTLAEDNSMQLIKPDLLLKLL